MRSKEVQSECFPIMYFDSLEKTEGVIGYICLNPLCVQHDRDLATLYLAT